MAITVEVRTFDDVVAFHHGHWLFQNKDSHKGEFLLTIDLPPHTLNAGLYKLTIIFAENYHDILLKATDIATFEIGNEMLAGNARILPGVMRPNLNYALKRLSE